MPKKAGGQSHVGKKSHQYFGSFFMPQVAQRNAWPASFATLDRMHCAKRC
jgi:hypothetical protein